MSGMTTMRGNYFSTFSGKSEVIVYGSGSDWIIQYANVTNPDEAWRRWFSDRSAAENAAREIAREPYVGMNGIRKKKPVEDPQRFA